MAKPTDKAINQGLDGVIMTITGDIANRITVMIGSPGVDGHLIGHRVQTTAQFGQEALAVGRDENT
jgi:methylmalonyl-CoA mutase cobalamin-binding subunit